MRFNEFDKSDELILFVKDTLNPQGNYTCANKLRAVNSDDNQKIIFQCADTRLTN